MRWFSSAILFHRKTEKDEEWRVTGKTCNSSDCSQSCSMPFVIRLRQVAAVRARWGTEWVCKWLS